MSEWKKKECTSVQGAAKRIGVSRGTIEDWIDECRIECRDGLIKLSDVENVVEKMNHYISLEAYLKTHDSDRFDSKYANHREKYWDYIESLKDSYNIKVMYCDEIPFPVNTREKYYFEKKDIPLLNKVSEDFFEDFGYSESEKCQKLLDKCENRTTKRLLTDFLNKMESFTPSVTAFVKVACKIDLKKTDNSTYHKYVQELDTKASQDMLVEYVEYARTKMPVNLDQIGRKKKQRTLSESAAIKAYPYKV
jgi:hypothetical protein